MHTTQQIRSNRENGQGLVEYALILVLVSITVIAALSLLGTSVNDVFYQVTSALKPSKIDLVRAHHWENSKVIIEVTYEGGYDSSIVLTTPYGTMSKWKNSYGLDLPHGTIDTTSCPCTIWVESNTGESLRLVTYDPGGSPPP